MADTMNVVVKNTFISVIGDDEMAEAEAARPRLNTEPAPELYLEDFPQMGDAESENVKCKMEAFDSSPRTFVGDHESEVAPCGDEESSSVGSPFCDSNVLDVIQSSSIASSPRLDLVAALQQDVLQETLDQNDSGNTCAGIPSEWQGKTSVMVRNLSYKCTRDMFRDELHQAGFVNSFDYVYVPVNTKRGTCKGYAFLNFVDVATAYMFKQKFDGRLMDVPGAVKPLEVIPANKQGFSENVSHYIDKRNEISTIVKPFPLPGSRINERRRGCDRSNVPNQHRKRADRKTNASHPDENQTMSMCHQCKSHVPSKNRFCQFCGAGLHMCAGASSFVCRT
eukprot:TRINITY_DN7463_c0_g1_i1.p1 TRINITY_DN7463_c0_g1~~TRINITY_DN7463_c0_g1_i1.p1  ORF type:complete len:337 (-),score=51.02 TRINITY_DN7463_c0_g1_i1:490-1500(-)